MRRGLVGVALTASLLVPAGMAYAAPASMTDGGTSQELPSNNGGDNGLGNCGHNSSGGAAHTGDNGVGGGNGGDHGNQCVTGTPDGGGGTPFPTS